MAAGGEGFDPVYQVVGAPPLLNLGGGVLQLPGFSDPLATQAFNVYDGTGASATDTGSINTTEGVTNLLGLTNTEFTVTGVTAAAGDTSAEAAALPAAGSVYDVFNLGNGIENIYTAIPGVSGAADTVTDTLVTPWGDLNLDSLFGSIDAVAALNPGDAFTAGLDAATSAGLRHRPAVVPRSVTRISEQARTPQPKIPGPSGPGIFGIPRPWSLPLPSKVGRMPCGVTERCLSVLAHRLTRCPATLFARAFV